MHLISTGNTKEHLLKELKKWIQYMPTKLRNNLDYDKFAEYVNISKEEAENFFEEMYKEQYLLLKFEIKCPYCGTKNWVHETCERFNCNECDNEVYWKEYLFDDSDYRYIANMRCLNIEQNNRKNISPIGLFKQKKSKNSYNIIELDKVSNWSGNDMNIFSNEINNSDNIKVFISYSHKDEKYKDELIKHLITLRREKVITEWHDKKILPGQDLDTEINKNLLSANIILLIISVDFLSSEYCYNQEMSKALEMNNNNIARVIPIIVRECDWTSAPFGRLKALPKDGKSVRQWEDEDAAYMDIVSGIKEVISDIKSKK